MALRHGVASFFATAPRLAASACCPYQQFRHGAPASNIFPKALHCSAPASSNSVRAPQPAAFAGCPYQQLRHGTPGQQVFPMALPASNKPHSAEKSTPVWLAIWCTWAGFANSQLWRATFSSTYLYMCPSTFLPNMTAARTEQIFRPICTDCLRHLRISAG